MAKATLATKRKSSQHEILDKLFRIDPETVTARDGSKRPLLIEHAMGKKGGMLTHDQLFQKAGLATEYQNAIKKLVKDYGDDDYALDQLTRNKKRKLNETVRSLITAYRAFLTRHYAPQRAVPYMARVTLPDQKEVFYIQGLVDATSRAPVWGDLDDLYLVAHAMVTSTLSANRKADEGRALARGIQEATGVSRELRDKCKFLIEGKPLPLLELKGK